MAAEMEQYSWVKLAKIWVMLQVAVLVVGLPLRVEVQRELYGVSTARDTTEATRRLRVVFKSRFWRMNRMVRLTEGYRSLLPALSTNRVDTQTPTRMRTRP